MVMRNIYTFFMLAFLSFSLTSCQKEIDNVDLWIAEKATLEFSVSSLEFSEAVMSQEVQIICNSRWVASVNESWVSLSDHNGIGDRTITVYVNEYSDTKPRTAELKITDGIQTRSLLITQAPGSSNKPDSNVPNENDNPAPSY